MTAPHAALLMLGAAAAPAVDPRWPDVAFLAQFDDQPDGSTTFTNLAYPRTFPGIGGNTTLTRLGTTATVSTTSPLVGAGSLAPNGAGGCWNGAGNWVYAYSPRESGAYTIECTFRTASATAVQALFDIRREPPYGDGSIFYLSGGQLRYHTNGVDRLVGGTIAANVQQWAAFCYYALTREMWLFLNGVQVAYAIGPVGETGVANSTNLALGSDRNGTQSVLQGTIDGCRITQGNTPRYTANYTPSTLPFPISA